MTRDTPTPNPPDLSNRGTPSVFEEVRERGTETDYRRNELEAILREGAWQEAFEEWSEYTDLSESEIATLDDREYFGRFDVFWDPTTQQLRFEAPRLPVGTEDALSDDVDAEITTINAELEDLGRTVIETITTAYVDPNEDDLSDLVWEEETFGEGIGRED